jgi:hypothetical protein
VHGIIKNNTEAINWGAYIGYLKNVERPGYYEKAGITEVEDRFRSWSRGRRPVLHPSLDETQLYPKMWQCFSKILGTYIDERMDKNSTQYDFSKRQIERTELNGDPIWVPHLVENDPVDYVPVPLSLLGKQLLVGKARVEQYFGVQDAEAVEVIEID